MNRRCPKEQLLQYIEKHRLQEAFPPEARSLVELWRYEAGEYLCLAGERVEYFSLIVEGRCKVVPSSEEGKEILLDYLSPLWFNGDIEMFCECDALHSVQAAEPTLAITISRKVFFGQMMEIPAFLRLLCKVFADKLYASSQQHSSTKLYPLKKRLSHYLLAAAQEADSDRVAVRMTELAQYLGITQRHLRRVLGGCEEEGLIRREGSAVVILDQEGLQRQAAHQ